MNKRSLLITALTAIFLIIILLIKTDLISPFDSLVYSIIAMDINDTSTLFFKSMTFLANTYTIICILIIILIIGFVLKKKNLGLIITGILAFNYLISETMKLIIQRPRPETLQLVHESSYSFPSGHTIASVSLCGILIYFILNSELDKTLKIALTIILTIIPILIAISRIYLGVHYGSDVLGGAILAAILLLCEISIIEKRGLY